MKSSESSSITLDTKVMEQRRVNRHNQVLITEAYSEEWVDGLKADPNASLWFVTFTFRTRRDQPIRGLQSASGLFKHFDRLYVLNRPGFSGGSLV